MRFARLPRAAFAALLLLGVSGVAVIPSVAHAAANTTSMAISPVSRDINANAGETVTGIMYVDTLSTTPVQVKMYPTPYAVTGEDYKQRYVNGGVGDASPWIHLTNSTYTIVAGNRAIVPYTVTIPKDAAPGGHYAVLFAEGSNSSNLSASQNVVNRTRVGTIFYITVNGSFIKKGSVASWKADWWQTSPPLEAALRIKNEGNTHFSAAYTINVSDMFGNQKAAITNSNVILPKTTRHIPIDWKEAPGFGLFKVSGTVQYLDNTEALKPHYVLMLSVQAFLAMLAAVIIVVVFALVTRPRNVRRRNK